MGKRSVFQRLLEGKQDSNHNVCIEARATAGAKMVAGSFYFFIIEALFVRLIAEQLSVSNIQYHNSI